MINRNQYRSLLESVNGAVSGNEISEEKALTWGDPRIGGARNAMELARYLNSQSGASTGTKSTEGSGPMGKKKKKPSASSAMAEASGWGSAAVGGARNAYELARYLNSQSGTNTGSTSTGGARPSGKKMRKPASSSTVAEGWGGSEVYGANNAYELAQRLSDKSGASTSSPSTTGSRPSGKKMKKPAASTTMAESEEIDAIDEILIEGIETYGEEGMAQILAHFAETGEVSQELADLIG